jgi:hypothetical protein
MDLQKYKIIFTSFNAQFSFTQTLLIDFLFINSFLSVKSGFHSEPA